MSTISSAISIIDRASAPLNAIMRSMTGVSAAARTVEGMNVGGTLGQMAAGAGTTSAAIDGVAQATNEMAVAASALEGANIESPFEHAAAGAENASASVMAVRNSIQQAENAMNLASLQAGNYRSQMEQIADSMDRNEAAISAMNRQQELTYSDRRQAEIERMITGQDRLNSSYQSAEVALARANNAYTQQQSRVAQLNQRLAETTSRYEQNRSRINGINQELVDAQRNTESVQRSAARSPFDRWSAKVITINQALALTRRIVRGITNSFNSVMGATKE